MQKTKVWVEPYGISGEVAIAKIKFTFSFFNIRSPQDVIFLKSAPAVTSVTSTTTLCYQNKILIKSTGIDAELGGIEDRHKRETKAKTLVYIEKLKEYIAIYDRVSDYYEMVVTLANMKSAPISARIREDLDHLRTKVTLTHSSVGLEVSDFIPRLTKLWKKTIDALRIVMDYNVVTKVDLFAKPDKKVTIEPGFYDLGMIKEKIGDLMKIDLKTARIEIGNREYPKYVMRPSVSTSGENYGDFFNIIGGNFPDILCNYKKINIHLEQLDFDSTMSFDNNGVCKRDRLLYSVDVMPVNGRFFGEQVLYKPSRLDFLPLRDGVHNELSFYFTDSCGSVIDMKSEVSLELAVRWTCGV